MRICAPSRTATAGTSEGAAQRFMLQIVQINVADRWTIRTSPRRERSAAHVMAGAREAWILWGAHANIISKVALFSCALLQANHWLELTTASKRIASPPASASGLRDHIVTIALRPSGARGCPTLNTCNMAAVMPALAESEELEAMHCAVSRSATV